MDEKKKIKICFAASSGGHYEQLMMLKPLMKKYDSFVITEKTDYARKQKIMEVSFKFWQLKLQYKNWDTNMR